MISVRPHAIDNSCQSLHSHPKPLLLSLPGTNHMHSHSHTFPHESESLAHTSCLGRSSMVPFYLMYRLSITECYLLINHNISNVFAEPAVGHLQPRLPRPYGLQRGGGRSGGGKRLYARNIGTCNHSGSQGAHTSKLWEEHPSIRTPLRGSPHARNHFPGNIPTVCRAITEAYSTLIHIICLLFAHCLPLGFALLVCRNSPPIPRLLMN